MDKRPPFSDLDLSRWKEYDDVLTGSLWLLGARDKNGPHVGDYWGNFVPQIIGNVQVSGSTGPIGDSGCHKGAP